MADSGEQPVEEVVNFDIFSGFSLSDEEIDVGNLTDEQQEALNRLMDSVNASQPIEKDEDYEAFEKQAAIHRHATCTEKDIDDIAAENNKDTTKWQTKWAVKVFKDWLSETNRDPAFEDLPDEILAGLLRHFFACVRKKNRQPYSKSGMINLCAGLNRYLQNPPNNCIINLMRNEIFQNANRVFTGKLRVNKQQGHNISKPKSAILQVDLDKLYNEYFSQGLASSNTEVLQQKVFFDLQYHTGRRAKEGLRGLTKDSVAVKTTPHGREYIEQTFNPVTKKNQGDEGATAYARLHNEKPILLEQDNSFLCPVNSFKHYLNYLNPKINHCFQCPNKAKNGFDAIPLGKNTLGTMMKIISEKAQLSRIYTNHEIRSTTATAMHKEKFDLKQIQNVTKHKNIQSLENYIGGPTLEDKESYSNALYQYATNKRSLAVSTKAAPTSPKKPKLQENTPPEAENQVALITEQAENDNTCPSTSYIQNNQNQVKQAPVMFGGATFQNCNITLNIPK